MLHTWGFSPDLKLHKLFIFDSGSNHVVEYVASVLPVVWRKMC